MARYTINATRDHLWRDLARELSDYDLSGVYVGIGGSDHRAYGYQVRVDGHGVARVRVYDESIVHFSPSPRGEDWVEVGSTKEAAQMAAEVVETRLGAR